MVQDRMEAATRPRVACTLAAWEGRHRPPLAEEICGLRATFVTAERGAVTASDLAGVVSSLDSRISACTR